MAVVAASGGAGSLSELPELITQVFHWPACGSVWAERLPANASSPVITRLILDIGTSLLLAGALFQVGDDLPALIGLVDMKRHVVIRDHRLRIGEPAFQCRVAPDDFRFLQRVRVLERSQTSSGAPINSTEPRTLLVAIESMTTSAALFKKRFSAAVLGARCR